MANGISFPGVFIEEIPAPPHPIEVVTFQVACVGYAAKGPFRKPIKVRSTLELETRFGPHHLLAATARAFFENGGEALSVIRLSKRDDFTTTAIKALQAVPDLGLLFLPGTTDPGIQNAITDFAASRHAFVILDPPAEITDSKAMADYAVSDELLPSRHAALYYPWLKDLQGKPMPPSGAVAGVYVRTDQERAVWKAPAGLSAKLFGISGFSQRLDDADSDRLNPLAVNALRAMTGKGNLIWGARTLAGADAQGDDFRYVPVRRTADLILASLEQGLQWTTFEVNSEPLWVKVRLSVEVFLNRLFREGAFTGSSTREAHFVQCGPETMSDADQATGRLIIHLGCAFLKPAEFVVLTLTLQVQPAP